MRKILFALLLASILTLIPVSSVLAINAPDSMSLISINAYQNVIESGDTFFLIYGNIQYTTYPTDYSADQAFLIRIFDPAMTEIAATTLYNNPYFHDGYGKFLVSFYFNAADTANLSIAWSGAYTIRLEANTIGVSWNGTPSPATVAITWSGSGWTTRIGYLIGQLQSAWGVSLIDSGTLTAYGENYGISVIPLLRTISPTLFSSYVITPSYTQRTKSGAYAILLSNQWVGTWLDLTTLSSTVHIPATWLYAGIWMAFMAGIIFVCIAVPGLATGQGTIALKNTKMIFFLVVVLLFFGGITGFLPWLVSILTGIVLALMIVNQLFWQKSYT